MAESLWKLRSACFHGALLPELMNQNYRLAITAEERPDALQENLGGPQAAEQASKSKPSSLSAAAKGSDAGSAPDFLVLRTAKLAQARRLGVRTKTAAPTYTWRPIVEVARECEAA